MIEFLKEFAIFLYKNNIIKFGDFTLASGKKSSFYIDLRLVPSYPIEFRKMIKALQNMISEEIGLDSFDSLVSVPTGGLVIASALAMETVKPIIYVRNKPKSYGTTKLIEGKINDGMQVLMIDDVATTGGSVIQGINALKESNVKISDVYVIINRLEGATESLESKGIKMHHLADILQVTEILYKEKIISKEILDKVKSQINK